MWAEMPHRSTLTRGPEADAQGWPFLRSAGVCPRFGMCGRLHRLLEQGCDLLGGVLV